MYTLPTIRIPKKNIPYIVVGIFTALLVFFILLYSNFGIINVLSYFESLDPYKDKIIYFYGEGCDQCDRVDDYLAANKVAERVPFMKLEVFANDHNRNILSDRAQICGIDPRNLGVPFVWEGAQRRCVLGDVDVITFFKEKIKLAPKALPKP